MGRKNDRVGFEAAWAEFHHRHYSYLYQVCFRACHEGDRREGAEDLANATFKRLFESKAQFNPPEDLAAGDMTAVVRAWLGRIASHIAIDHARKEEDGKPIHLEQDEWQDIREMRTEGASEHTHEVCRIMNDELDEREQDVIRTTFKEYDPCRVHQKLASEDIRTLAARWETTPENIRQVRKRALAKLKKALPASMSGASSERAGP